MIPFDAREGWIWLDGELVPWQEAKTHMLTHTLHYGMGVFEGVRAYQSGNQAAIFRLTDHTKRLFASAHIVGMSIPFTQSELNEAQRLVIKKNKLMSGYIRPLCYYGSEGMGLKAKHLKTHVMIAAWEWEAYLGTKAMREGISCKTSSYRRLSLNSNLGKAKVCGNYVNSVLASDEAAHEGYDEALLLDEKGAVAEGPGENIFMVKDSALYTPNLEYVLAGITRDSIITVARDESIPIIERTITRDELYVADEVFMTGTAAEVVPVRSVDRREIGSGKPGPLTTRFQSTYNDIVCGKNTQYKNWLVYV